MRMTGSIRTLSKGFGFIAGDDGLNYYFHWSGMSADSKDFRDLQLRERVDFSVAPNFKKAEAPRAVDIRVVIDAVS